MLRKVIVEIKPALETRSQALAIKDDRPDKSTRVIGLTLSTLLPSDESPTTARELRHPMSSWQQTGQNAGMG